MKKLLLLLVVWCCISVDLMAQTLTGVVYDELTKQPVYNANVYLRGTSYYTITDSLGKFTLTVRQAVNTSLIISHLAYEEVTYANPFRSIPAQTFLKEKVAALSEVTIVRKVVEKYNRDKKLAVFRRHFLGTTTAGKACRIVNEDDVELIYNSERMQLTASCSKPLQIENKYLGYEIQFTLHSFEVNYSNNSLADNSVTYSLYAGTSVFKDVSGRNARIKRRREDTYEKSAPNFFRHLVEGTLGDTNWTIMKNKIGISQDQCFRVTDDDGMKKISLLPGMEGHDDSRSYARPVYGEIEIHDKRYITPTFTQNPTVFQYDRDISIMAFSTVELYTDNYGNISPVDRVLFLGIMGEQRLGDMLPMDFEPEEKQK